MLVVAESRANVQSSQATGYFVMKLFSWNSNNKNITNNDGNEYTFTRNTLYIAITDIIETKGENSITHET